MEEKIVDQVEATASTLHYCPNEGAKMVHKDSLTYDPDLSGWECPVCFYTIYD